MSPRPRFLLTFLGWSGGLSGGDRHLLEVAASWREHVDIGVLAPAGAGSTIQSFLGEVRVHTLGQRRATAGPRLAAEYVKRSALILLRERSITADYVVAGSHFTADTAALVSLVRRGATGVSYVYHLVAERSGLAPRTVWSKLDERVGLTLLRRFATVVFTSNSNTARTLAEHGFDPVRTAVGVDLASFPRVDPGALPPQGAFVARMARSKGVHDAVEAWARVRAEVHDARLVMIGAGPERSKGMALAERLGIAEAIQWPGFVSDDEKRRILARSRVLLAPSYEEGWGISVCEAL